MLAFPDAIFKISFTSAPSLFTLMVNGSGQDILVWRQTGQRVMDMRNLNKFVIQNIILLAVTIINTKAVCA
jgi:hypothetical protein